MLTPLTLAAIAILHHISGIRMISASTFSLSPEELSTLLDKLERSGLIQHLDGQPRNVLSSYKLMYSNSNITLLQVLQATDQHLNCNNSIHQEMYEQHREVAVKLGIVNQVTRKYLTEITLADF